MRFEMDFSQQWIWRLMEIRKNPSVATHEDVLKMADDIFYTFYSKRVEGAEQVNISNSLASKISIENISK